MIKKIKLTKKMKKKLIIMIILAIGFLVAQEATTKRIKVRVIDEEGKPVPNMEVNGVPPTQWKTTNSKGEVEFKVSTLKTFKFFVAVTPTEEYYKDNSPAIFPRSESFNENKIHDIVIKQKKNPISLYRGGMNSNSSGILPKLNQPIGYDLLIGDWVAPHGKGKINTLLNITKNSLLSLVIMEMDLYNLFKSHIWVAQVHYYQII